MKLCLVVPGFSASEDDWCIPSLHHLVRRLAADHEVLVVALRHPARQTEYGFFGARVRPLGAGTRTGLSRLTMIARARSELRRAHRRAPFDVIHGLWVDEAGFVAAAAGRTLGLRSVVSVMGGELVGLPDIGYGTQLGRTGRWLVRRSLRAATVATVGARSLEPPVRELRRGGPLAWAPLGVDTSLFTAEGAAAPLAGEPCLLQVASLTPVKGQRLLLKAFATVSQSLPRAHLHLVGDGPERVPLERAIREHELDRKVSLHGAVPHHELPPYYRAADLHVVSSRFESQSMATLEAAACGTATVGTAVGILPESGLPTAPPGDAAALAAAAVGVLESTDGARRLGETARAWVHDSLSLERCVSRLLDLYSSPPSDIVGEERRR